MHYKINHNNAILEVKIKLSHKNIAYSVALLLESTIY